MATIDELLRAARERLTRLSAEQVAVELAAGALVVDIRPFKQRREFGQIPGSPVTQRTARERSLDQGRDLGLRYATDLVGGVSAWKAAGLPVVEADSEE